MPMLVLSCRNEHSGHFVWLRQQTILKLAHEDFINWETINEKTSKGNDFNDIGRAHHPQYTKKDCYEEVIMHTHIGGEGNKIIR